MGNPQETSDWGARFQATALEPDRWVETLRSIADATGSNHAQLIGLGGPAAIPFNWISDVGEQMVEKFDRIEGGSPTINFRIAADLLPGVSDVVHETHYDLAKPTLAKDDYQDFCSDYDIPLGCQTRLMADGRSLIGFALLRSHKNGATTPEQRALFAEMSHHARSAVRLQAAIEHRGFALIGGSMEAMSRAAFLLDGAGRVQAMTSRAEALLTKGRLRLIDGRLGCAAGADNRAIERAQGDMIMAGTVPAPLLLDARDAPGKTPLLLEFFPLPRREWAFHFAPRGIVVVREADSPDPRAAETLMTAFSLTPAEADVALLVAQGLSRTMVAMRRGVTIETLKAQMRAIYAKTGCAREADLVRMVGFVAG